MPRYSGKFVLHAEASEDLFLGAKRCYSLTSFPTFCHLSLLNELRNVLYPILSVCTTGMSGVLNYRPPKGWHSGA